MLTGKNIRAPQGKRMGLVDAVVEPLGNFLDFSNIEEFNRAFLFRGWSQASGRTDFRIFGRSCG